MPPAASKFGFRYRKADAGSLNSQVGGINKSITTYDPSLSIPVDSLTPLQKRDKGIARQWDAADEMKFLSQPYHLGLRNFNDYVYDGSAGYGVTVYVSDTGANLNNIVFGPLRSSSLDYH